MSQQLSGAGAPDPVVELKQQELQLRAQRDQAEMQRDQADLQLRNKQIDQSGAISRERIQSQEKMLSYGVKCEYLNTLKVVFFKLLKSD